MKQIVIRNRTDPGELLCVESPDSAGAVLSVAAAPDFVGQTPPEVMRVEHDRSDGPLRLQWKNASAQGTVHGEQIQTGIWMFHCDWCVTKDFVSSGIGWTVEIEAFQPRVLNGAYRMSPLTRPLVLNGLTPMVMRARSPGPLPWVSLVATDSLLGHDWSVSGSGRVRGTIWFDHPLAHPRFTFEGPQFRNWHNAYQFRAGCQLSRTLYIITSDRPTSLLIPGRYPGRHRAVFSITDHADHDTCERLAALWYGSSRTRSDNRVARSSAGFVGLRLPFTKSVFTATPQSDGPGLHYEPFAQLCRQGYAAGIEICPHGVHSSVQPAVSELAGLLDPFAEFKPLTWIDHGNHFLSNYGRRGWDPDDEYSLLPLLDRLGIKYVWGRADFGQSLPQGQLDQVAIERFCGWSYVRDLPGHAVRSLAIGRPWAVLHSLSSVAFQLVPELTMMQYFRAQRSIQRVMKADVAAIPTAVWQSAKMLSAVALPPGLNRVVRHFRNVREELSRCPIFFPEHDSVARGIDDRWLFNTVAVHDVAKAYSASSIDRLLDSYGIHLSHTYLTSVSRAHVSHAIEPDGQQHWRLTPEFDKNLRNLAGLRDRGRLWVASMGEIGQFWRSRHRLRLTPRTNGQWQLSLPADADNDQELEPQIVVVGSAKGCQADDRQVDLDTLDDDVRLGTVRIRPGQMIRLECLE